MTDGKAREIRLQGLPISEGYAVSKVCLFNDQRHSNLPVYRVEGSGLEREIERVQRALSVAAERLDEVRRKVEKEVGRAESEIFAAQKTILEDAVLRDEIVVRIRAGNLNAETAIEQVLNEYEARILSIDNLYLRERASDFGEIKRRLLDVLGNMKPSLQCGSEQCRRGRDRIVVAEELTPSLTVDIDMDHTVGFVTEHGGVNSHAAILARAMGIPAVSGLAGIRDRLGCGTQLLINGYTGEVILWPSRETLANMQPERDRVAHLPTTEPSVAGFSVMANVNAFSDMRDTRKMEADGVGLYRTEFELLVAGRLFREEELFERYAAVLKALPGKPVWFRLFDIGSDKRLPFLNLPPEENPSLGWRGARLLLGRFDILRVQARALAQCSVGHRVYVTYPMIVDVEQFVRLKAMFCEAVKDLPKGEIWHGAMFEVPSACLQAEELYRVIDFGSVGTNDLTQYLFAVDRDNDLVSDDYRPDRPIFWKLLSGMARAARAAGKPLSVCGEMAGDPRYTRKFMEAGIRSVSVSPRRIAGVRRAARAALTEAG
jgi:phosphoenolpyruvate-protein phosphotransferase (PTS system enzyme I)